MQRLAFILCGAIIAFACYFVPWPSDARRETRWHDLQQRQFLHNFQQLRHDEYGDPAPTMPALTADEQAELSALNKWAEKRGERFEPTP